VSNPGGVLSQHEWPKHPEDLTYSPTSDNLWSLTEDPGARHVFAVKMAELLGGCGK
jgi:hypothetical protein